MASPRGERGRSRLARARDRGVPTPRDDGSRGGLLREPGRRQRGGRRQVLRVDAGADRSRAWDRAHVRILQGLRGDRNRKLRARNDPSDRSCPPASYRVRIRAKGAFRGSHKARAAGDRPQARCGLEWPCHLRPRARGESPRRRSDALRRGRGGGLRPDQNGLRAGPPAKGVRGRTQPGARLPGRSRRRARGLPRPPPRRCGGAFSARRAGLRDRHCRALLR